MTTRHTIADRGYIDARVEAVGEAQLAGPVRAALGDTAARVVEWTSDSVDYDFVNPSSGGVYRFRGSAVSRESSVGWKLVLKVTRSTESLVHDQPLPPGLADALARALQWDREQHAFESGFLANLEGPLVAPKAFGWSRNSDETSWLWLEDLSGFEGGQWPVKRYGDVGSALGLFNGRYLTEPELPSYDWLGRDWLRVWVLQITPLWFGRFQDAETWDDPAVAHAYPQLLRDRLLDLWESRHDLLAALGQLPRTCAHLDAHRRNLFTRNDQLVAIDWGLVGTAAAGEEIASTLVGTIASGVLPPDDAYRLAAVLYESYLEGMRAAGWKGPEHQVRLAFSAAAALRTFSILSLDATDHNQLTRSAELARTLLDLGDEARTLA